MHVTKLPDHNMKAKLTDLTMGENDDVRIDMPESTKGGGKIGVKGKSK